MTPRRVLVTGGNRGIGEAIARRLREDGHQVVVTSRSGDPVEGLDVVACEITDSDSVDAAFAEVAYDEAPGDWRRGVGAVVEANRALLDRHPWLLDVDTSRPPLGPGTIGKYDAELALLAPAGLPDVEIDQALTVLLDLVRSGVRQAATTDAGADGEWWAVAGPLLAEAMEGRDFPFASRVGQAAGQEYGAPSDPDRALRFAVEALVAGIEARVR